MFLKSMTLKKKLFFENRFWKQFCTQKITFWFNLPRKMCKFCQLRAILKNTSMQKIFSLKCMIWNVNFFLKSLILKEKSFCKKHDFELKIFLRVRFWIEKNTTRHILIWQFYNVSDFLSTFWTRVRFYIEYFTCQILSVLLLQFAKVFMCSSKQGTFR